MILCEIMNRNEKIQILDLKLRFRINKSINFSKIYQVSTENYFICETKQKIWKNIIFFSPFKSF